jgi:deoxyxylulose-5-phosphate synthase
VVTVEDGLRVGGVGSRLTQELHAAGVDVPTLVLGLAPEFVPHSSRDEILAAAGLTGQDIARQAVEQLARMDHQVGSDQALASGERLASFDESPADLR